jgi:HPt (histidine-containing phosphotransfer) domain-containing protein
MEIQWNSAYLDLEKLISLSRGDKDRMLKYLNQFQDLIPSRVESLKISLEAEDRKMVRQILHQMSPQLQFFGIPDVIGPVKRLELEYETMPFQDLELLIFDILEKLDEACKEVDSILEKYF